MKNWIISQTDISDKYLIPTEKSIWISEQPKGVNIQELIENKKLRNAKSIRYDDLKEIVFIDSDSTIEFNFIDDKTTDEELKLNKIVFSEIRSYLKNNLKGTELKNYSIFKQVTPHLVILGVTTMLTVVTYLSAIELENEGTVRISGGGYWFKKIIAIIAELFGATGTLIVGIILIGLLTYLLIRKIQNPKKGEILKITNSSKLTI
jgi:hypothetical protein